jgi:hypothetical protein
MEFSAEQRREFARMLGSIRTEKKARSSRENGKKGGRRIKPLETISCTCGGDSLEHRSTCPRGRVIRYRRKKGLPLL